MTIFAAAIALGTVAAPPGERGEVVTPPPIVRVPVTSPPPPRIIAMPPPPPSPPPPPRQPLPTPSAEARALALTMLDRVALFEVEARRQVLNQLRWPRNGTHICDLANAECAQIAGEIADRETPPYAMQMRDVVSRILGAQFDRTMTPAQIADANRYLTSDSGRALIGSFVSIDERTLAGLDPPNLRFATQRDDLTAEFVRRTEHLPRAPRTVISTPTVVVRPPPAPPIPPPPRKAVAGD